MTVSRRRFITRAVSASIALSFGTAKAAGETWHQVPHATQGLARPRLVLVNLRGGLDGLTALPPVGDPDYAALREADAHAFSRSSHGALPLDDLFGLHPRLQTFAHAFTQGQLVIAHSVAPLDRGRSHFPAQAALECGSLSALQSGWLARGLAARRQGGRAIAVGAGVPLVLREEDVSARSTLTAHWHPGGPLLDHEVLAAGGPAQTPWGGAPGAGYRADQSAVGFVEAARIAADALAAAEGADVATLDLTGFDTHADQGGVDGRLSERFSVLDRGIAELRATLGPDIWARTLVLVVSEFGRSARLNVDGGTDHGMAGPVFLVGGALNGSRILGRWPGLREADLFEGRDVAPSLDFRSLAMSVLRDHLGVSAPALEERVFSDSVGVRPIPDLIGA